MAIQPSCMMPMMPMMKRGRMCQQGCMVGCHQGRVMCCHHGRVVAMMWCRNHGSMVWCRNHGSMMPMMEGWDKLSLGCVGDWAKGSRCVDVGWRNGMHGVGEDCSSLLAAQDERTMVCSQQRRG
jgi:hypothetical protein